MIRVLGIDPGSNITGFGIIDWDGRNARYIESGCIRVGHLPVHVRLGQIYHSLATIITHFKPQTVAIEQIFLAHSVSSALKLGQARGAAMVAVARASLPLAEYSARQVKSAVVGRGQADKKQVQYMIQHLLKLSLELPLDASDALGIAWCHIQHTGGLARLHVGEHYSMGAQPVSNSGIDSSHVSFYKRKRVQ